MAGILDDELEKIKHPMQGILDFKRWIDEQMQTGMGQALPQDEGSIYAMSPLDLARIEAAINLTGLAELGSMPGAQPKGGILGKLNERIDGGKSKRP